MDIGDINNVHPVNKQYVGKRLAMMAFARTCGYSDQVYSGLVLKEIKITKIHDNQSIKGIRLFFDHVHGGLVIQNEIE